MARNEIPIRCEHTEMKAIEDLKPHPRNPNKHTDDQIKRLADIIEYQGWRRPIRVSKQSGYITAGHGALEAAKLKGWPSAPVDYQNYENTDQEYADIVADNSLHEWAGVGIDLKWVNAEMENLGPDFDVDMLGLENFEIELADKFEDKDADSVPGNAEARCKEGDLWVLGEHRLLCGDCTVKENVERLMDGEKADMLFTDPPYNVGYDYNFPCDNKTKDDYLKWSSDWTKISFSLLKDDSWFFAKNAPKNLLDFQPILRNNGFEFRNLIVWIHPPSLFPSNRFYDNWEAICSYSKGKPLFNKFAEKRTVEKPLSQGGGFHNSGRIGDVWDGIKYISAGAMASKEAILEPGTKRKAHPCQMPIALPERSILFCSQNNFIVFDPFLGSGSTLIACEKTGRICYGMEIDPAYCNIIIERWETFTGKEAKLINGNKG